MAVWTQKNWMKFVFVSFFGNKFVVFVFLFLVELSRKQNPSTHDSVLYCLNQLGTVVEKHPCPLVLTFVVGCGSVLVVFSLKHVHVFFSFINVSPAYFSHCSPIVLRFVMIVVNLFCLIAPHWCYCSPEAEILSGLLGVWESLMAPMGVTPNCLW